VQVGLNGLRAHEGFTQARQPFIGVQTHPNDVGKFVQADGFELGDFHKDPVFDVKKAPQLVAVGLAAVN
jgi:hypothetical protein